MGMLRLFLAISVVVTHTAPVFGMHFMPGNEAVRIFFMISGFYMALVLSSRYKGRPWLFYSNRLLRLYPMYLVALALIVAIQLATGPTTFLGNLLTGRWDSAQVLAMIPNFTMFGGDVLFSLHQGVTGLHFTFGVQPPAADPTAVRTGIYLLNPPAWSIGIELWFYLLAPAILLLRTRSVIALAALSFALQLWVDHLHSWSSYFFFPANLCFFLYGVLGYRFTLSRPFKLINDWALPAGLRLGGVGAILALLVFGAREFIPLFRNYSWMHYTAAVIAIPFIFDRFKAVKWDRWVGELSYPVYILHSGALTLTTALFGKATPGWVLLLVVPTAIAGTLWVEAPLERWRAARAQRSGKPPSGNDGAAVAQAAAE